MPTAAHAIAAAAAARAVAGEAMARTCMEAAVEENEVEVESHRRHTQSAACERARDARLHATGTRITPASLRGKRRHLKMRLQATLEFATCQSPPRLPTTKSICTATACHAREAAFGDCGTATPRYSFELTRGRGASFELT